MVDPFFSFSELIVYRRQQIWNSIQNVFSLTNLMEIKSLTAYVMGEAAGC